MRDQSNNPLYNEQMLYHGATSLNVPTQMKTLLQPGFGFFSPNYTTTKKINAVPDLSKRNPMLPHKRFLVNSKAWPQPSGVSMPHVG